MTELLWAQGGVCRKFSGFPGGYAGPFVGRGGLCRNFRGLRGGYARTFGVFWGDVPELFGA